MKKTALPAISVLLGSWRYLTHTIFNFHAYMVGIDPMHSMSGKTCGWMIVCPHNCETSWCPILRRCEINKSSERVGWPSQLRNIVLSWPPKMSFSPAENENIFETTSLRDIDLWPWVRPWAEPCCNQSLGLAPVPQHLPLSISFFSPCKCKVSNLYEFTKKLLMNIMGYKTT